MNQEKVSDKIVQTGIRTTTIGIAANAALVAIKLGAGIYGHSNALVADAIESGADVLSSTAVLIGLKLSRKPADKTHPYGHGKFEPLAAACVSIALVGAAIFIIIESIHEIIKPSETPAAFTLIVLLLAILIKERLYRLILGVSAQSTALRNEAWHHRSDAITSAAAFLGISIALLGGPGFEISDDIAALIAAFVIIINAVLLFKPALYELLDTAPDESISKRVREVACAVPGVFGTHKCHVRKLGFDYFVDLDVLCDPEATIRAGHEIAHQVGAAIQSAIPAVAKVLVHVEPSDDFGKRSKDNLGI